MKLNKKGLNELRKKIIELLNQSSISEKIKLDKNLLEELLFEVVILNKEDEIKVKLPIWSGTFLQKIDLSEVDFEDVSWCILDTELCSDFQLRFDDIKITEKRVFDKIDRIRRELIDEILEQRELTKKEQIDFIIDFSFTNANIDLSKSFETKHGDYIFLRNCTLEGLDLSHHNLNSLKKLYFVRSSISNTELSIPSKIEIYAKNSYLQKIDLSSRTINARDYFLSESDFYRSDLSETGINIILEPSIKVIARGDTLKQIQETRWSGCYINGKRILTTLEKEKIAKQKAEEYAKMKDDLFETVLSDINKQIIKK